MNKKRLPFIVSLILGSISGLSHADSLSDVYQLALTKDPQVQKAAATVEANIEGITQAKSVLFPQINFSTSATKSYSDGSQNLSYAGAAVYYPANGHSISNNYNFSLSQEIFSLATWQNLERAEKASLRSEVNLTLTKQNLIKRVTQIYFDVLKAQDNLEFAQAEKKAIERQLEQTNQRYKVGLTAITDVHEARAQFDNATATVIRFENNVEIQKELLREITGQYPTKLSVLNTERFSTAAIEKNAADWVTLAQSNNRELQIQTINMDIAKQNIDLAFSGHLPTVNLSASTGSSNTNASTNTLNAPADVLTSIGRDKTEHSNPPSSDSKSIGISISVPLFSGFATESKVKQAQANYVVASEDRELTYRAVERSVRTSFANVSTYISTIKAQEQALISAESALKATEAGFEVGTRTIVDVLDSTQKLFSAKRNLSSSRYDYILAVLSLKAAAGTVSDSDIEAINKGLKD